MPKRTYRPNYSPPIDPRAQEIKALRRELSDLRHDLIRLQPQEIADLLFSYYGCTTRAEWEKWKRDTAGAVIQHAKVDPAQASYPGIEERAACPLCGDGTTAFGARGGFAYPGGLERHLRGYGNMHQCTVLGTAFKLAADYLHETLLASDRAEKEREQKRRELEPMVQHAAQAPPAFLYQNEWRGPARGEAKIGEAEQRLHDLGFEIIIEGNVRTYRFVQDDWLVLADPRGANKIEFEVTSLTNPKKTARHWRANTFYMLDSYALDVPGKFRKRLQEAIESFAEATKS
ncbi:MULTISPECIES: hypothetical protein [unclassified Bradyrhizobium]|nr:MULTISPECIES: hypothetical protein [unclassified Bradyrhizobium]MCK1554747.1 hypothetical protein [Bradyrhizobium sp. 177]MCK1592094.1 hypothetical protein [Bradyrhizobium sp. 169]MCK1692409.1 hypothetical protein [Bradyrhizobium sp. 144]MCK1700807.1 hypothetical protein [Bradyrhizobium sp. 146]